MVPEGPVLIAILVSVAILSLISLIGALGLTTNALRRHGVIMALVALAAGTLVGDTFLHILPETVAHYGSFSLHVSSFVLLGFVLFFIFEVVLRWEHSHAAIVDDHHGHGHDEVAAFGWLNLASDAAHNLIDGMIIAAAYLADIKLGIITTVAVAFHEIPQELGDFAVLLRAGMVPRKALLMNLGSSLTSLVGAIVVLMLPIDAETIASVALPIVAGAFLYIAASDLVPELHHHSKGKDAALILGMFLVGIALMYALLDLEAILPFDTVGDDHGHGHAHG